LHLGAVLDVGAGLALSKNRIPLCMTQDVAFGLPVEICANLTVIRDQSFDSVTAFDVLEHVVEDVDFLNEMCRIARKYVLLTTPNFNVSHAANGYHCREYTPKEFFHLAAGVKGWVISKLWSGEGEGFVRREWVKWSEFQEHTDAHQAVLLGRIDD